MRALALALAIVVLPSCSDDPPADVGGSYDVTVATDDDGCDLGVTTGDSTITLSQDADDMTIVTAEVDGAVAPFLGITVGGTTFTGSLSGHAVTSHRAGAARQIGGCTYHVDADLDAVVDGDTMSGTLTYAGVNNDSVDCEFVDDCESTQSF